MMWSVASPKVKVVSPASIDLVAVGVEDELAGDAVGGGAEDAEFVSTAGVAVPVADDGLVAGLTEVERLAGIEHAVAVQVEVPDAVIEVADVGCGRCRSSRRRRQ